MHYRGEATLTLALGFLTPPPRNNIVAKGFGFEPNFIDLFFSLLNFDRVGERSDGDEADEMRSWPQLLLAKSISSLSTLAQSDRIENEAIVAGSRHRDVGLAAILGDTHPNVSSFCLSLISVNTNAHA